MDEARASLDPALVLPANEVHTTRGRCSNPWRAQTAQTEQRKTLLALYDAAVAAAHPDVCLPPHLPRPPEHGRLYVVGAGKAAAAMAVAAEAHYRKLGTLDRVTGFTTAPHGTPEALTGARPTRDRDRLGATSDAR